MQSLPRRLGQRYFELPRFIHMGLDAQGKDVLEIGCGSGYGGYLLNRLQPRSYVGLDVMEEQIQIAGTKYPDIDYRIQNATHLDQFENESVDVVVIFGVLHHIPEWRKTLDEIYRVLRQGGSLFLEEPRGLDLKFFDLIFRWGHPDTDFGLNALEDHLEEGGFFIRKKQWTPLLTMYHISRPETFT